MYLGTFITTVSVAASVSAKALNLPTVNGRMTQHRVRAENTSLNFSAGRQVSQTNTGEEADNLNGNTYDYVIVGAGTAGLAVAARLTEDEDVTVAVIEAGGTGEDRIQDILSPAQSYLNGVATMSSPYDWHFNTANQTALNERQVYFPRGKILGGSSAVNGLYMVRTSEREQNAWRNLLDVDDARQYWTWENNLEAFKRSEHFDAPTSDAKSAAHIQVTDSYHGEKGPIHYGFPGFTYPQNEAWIPTFDNLGISTVDPYGGYPFGAFITPSAINAENYTRSYAKTGYLDPNAQRTNLHVLSGYMVTKVNFDNTTATGVTFVPASGTQNDAQYTVNASKDVVLSAGVIGTPHILQLSGIGPKDLLDQYNIDVIQDLPGVGSHFQDHLSAEITFKSNTSASGDILNLNKTFAKAQWNGWLNNDPNSWYNAPNDAIAYVNLTTVLNNSMDATNDLVNWIDTLKDQYIGNVSNDKTVQSGYSKIHDSEVHDILTSDVGAIEILMANTGSYSAYGNDTTISLQAAIQHPLSRGSVRINSDSAFDAPTIDPGYLTHPADIVILRQGFKWVRSLATKEPLSEWLQDELSPGSDVQTDEDWENFIRGSGSTEYHPAGTASMIPRDMGGVVNNSLHVYGVNNLRVADTSLIPLSFSAHLCSPAYAIGETAAMIFKGEKPAAANTTASTPSNPSSGSKDNSTDSSSSQSSSSSASSGDGRSAKHESSSAFAAAPVTLLLALTLLSFVTLM